MRLAIMIVVCVAATPSARAAMEYANITGGRVQGEVKDGLASFKGLPFAAPPVGALRWRVPQPVVAWNGVRKADIFAPACIQPWAGNHDPMVFSDSSHSQRLPNLAGLKALDGILRCEKVRQAPR